jgi:hypothetical protein
MPLVDTTHLVPELNDVPVNWFDFRFDLDFDVLKDEEDLVLHNLTDEFFLLENAWRAEGGACAAEFAWHRRFLNIMHLFSE